MDFGIFDRFNLLECASLFILCFVSKKLFEAGACLEIYDPMVQKKTILNDIEREWKADKKMKSKRINIVEKLNEIKKCDAFIILTEWEEFKKIDWEEIAKGRKVFDGRNILNKSKNIYQIGK